MKKTALLLAGFMLAGAAFSLAGCGNDGSIGKIDGNFKEEATKEQIYSETISAINMNQSVDTANGFGFEIKAELDFSVDMEMSYQNQTSKSSTSGDLNEEYKLTAALPEGEQSPVYTGAGKVSMNMKTSSKVAGMNTTSEMKANANAYNDTQYVYLDAEIMETPMFVKFSIEDLMGQIGGNGQVPGLPEEVAPAPLSEVVDVLENEGDADSEIGMQYNLSTVLAGMQEEGFKIYLDTSKGVKVKVSAGEDMMYKILSQTEFEIPADAMTFSACVFDIYLVFGEDGKFTQFGVDMDVAASLDLQNNGEDVSVSLSMKGGVSIKTYSGEVTLPEGIADDKKYELKSF